jgi:hypothetical protein
VVVVQTVQGGEMKKAALISVLTIVLLFGYVNQAKSQYIEDALRYAIPNGMITPRVAAFNVAYHGLSDDIGALMYNPAGLTLPQSSELSFGFGFTRNSTETEFMSLKNLTNTNNGYISHFGLLIPIENGKHRAAIGIGYFLESNYDDNMKYDAFNPTSTFIANEAQFGPRNYQNNFATDLGLANRYFYTPIKDSLQQSAFILEKGGLHNITGGAAFDLNDYVSVGFTITGKWGNYSYNRHYIEADIYNKYNHYDTTFSNVDFSSLDINEIINADISGVTGSVGIQARILDFMRFGATIKFPTWYQINENFSQSAASHFDNGDLLDSTWVGQTSYHITTPFVYCAGLSFYAQGLTFTTGIEYTDVSQIVFSDATTEVQNLNMYIAQMLVGQVTWGFGAEYKIPLMPLFVRASYASTTSPYGQDIPNAYLSHFSLGGGLLLGDNIRLDGLFRWKNVSQLRTNYGSGTNASTYIFTTMPMDIGFQLTYRY